jgi:hypothetical protein
VKLLRSKTGDAIGVEVNVISLRSLLRALSLLPTLKIEESKQNIMNDEASAVSIFKGIRFEVHTPFSDYWIDRPENCPEVVFDEIVECLEQFPVRWWHRIP